jgi:hypothetical protein
MRGERRIDDLFRQPYQHAQRAEFGRADEPAVGGEDVSKPAFDALLAHGPLLSAIGCDSLPQDAVSDTPADPVAIDRPAVRHRRLRQRHHRPQP